MVFLEIELVDKIMNFENEVFLIQKVSEFQDVQNFRDNIVLVNVFKKFFDFYVGKGEKMKKKGGWLKFCISFDKYEKFEGNDIKVFLVVNIGVLFLGEYGY